MDLASYLVAFMSVMVPVQHHAYYEPREATEARYLAIAEDITAVVDEQDALLFDDPGARDKTALLLASIASYESQFHAHVDDCRMVGDQGHAFGLWQTHAPREDVCSSRKNAARIALRMVRQSFDACTTDNVADRLALYTDGACRRRLWRSRTRVLSALNWWSLHPREDDDV